MKRNSELETRITELEVELSVWKQAHNNILEAAERDKKAHHLQAATLNRQLSSLDTIKVRFDRHPRTSDSPHTHLWAQNPLIVCAVDGNDYIFNQAYLSRGISGGQDAARDLTKAIAEFLSQEDVQVFGRLSFWITLFFNRGKLLDTLLGSDICTAEQFSAFLIGFSQASPRFLIVDAGPGQDAVNLKVRGEKFIWIAPFARCGGLMIEFYPRILANIHSVPSDPTGVSRRYASFCCPSGHLDPALKLVQ